jgi:uncharacterized protein
MLGTLPTLTAFKCTLAIHILVKPFQETFTMEQIFAGGPSSTPQGSTSRTNFIRSTYTHLAGAMLAFIALSGALHMTGAGLAMLKMLGSAQYMWLAVMGAFMLVGWLASHLADTAASNQTQLTGLGIYVVAEALIFAPLFAIASLKAPGAFTSKSDFSFLGGFLKVGGLVALGTIVAGAIFGFSLGIWFSGLMVLFSGACVLYDTSKIIHSHPVDRPAGAALHLFASIALMLWYVLRILISLATDD